jgi:hypothetical protein
MKSCSDHDVFEYFCSSLDRRSEAFRLKMLKHFESRDCKAWAEAEEVLKRDEPAKTSGFAF